MRVRLLIELLLPTVNSVTGKNSHLGMLGVPLLVGGLVLMGVLVTLLAGAVPAFVLSSIPPVKMLKGEVSRGTQGGMVKEDPGQSPNLPPQSR